MIPALVLTAGLATRLRPLSCVRAKAALPVAGVPLVRRILRQLARDGISDVVLNLHHLPHTITTVVGNGEQDGVRVRYSWEVPVLGSAGGPRHALPLLGAATFLIVNGDTLTDVNLSALVDDHRQSGALVTMAVVANTEPEKYSGLKVEADGTVTGVIPRGSTEHSYHFIGIQVAEAPAFATLPDNVPSESVRQLYPALIAERPGSVRAFVTAADFLDIGTPEDYFNTSFLLASLSSPADLATLDSATSRVASDAHVERAILWDDVDVEAGATLRHCIVTDGVRIPAGSSWEDAIIRVADGALAAGEELHGTLAVARLSTL